MYLSIYLSVYLYTYISIHLSIYNSDPCNADNRYLCMNFTSKNTHTHTNTYSFICTIYSFTIYIHTSIYHVLLFISWTVMMVVAPLDEDVEFPPPNPKTATSSPLQIPPLPFDRMYVFTTTSLMQVKLWSNLE